VIIIQVPQDPTDQVLQGMQSFAELAPMPTQADWSPQNVLQGESVNKLMGYAVPRATVGWMPYAAQAASIGPMAFKGGIVSMIPIGPDKFVSPTIAPAQIFLNALLPNDITGALFTQDVVMGYAEPATSKTVASDSLLCAISAPTMPPQAVTTSGLLKTITNASLPDEFGRVVLDRPISYQVFTLSGTTVDGAGGAVANCRVIAYQSGLRYVSGAPIIAETVSDGAGAFSMLLRNIDYQLTAYKAGTPDKAGITRQDITPVVATTIYLSDPTVPSSGGTRAFTFA